MSKYYGKSELDLQAEVIYDLVTSGELDREEGIATIKLNLELAANPPWDVTQSIRCPIHDVQPLYDSSCAECYVASYTNQKETLLDNMKTYKDINYIVTQNRMLGFPLAYIQIPENHPWYKIDSYEDIPLGVHGGLTFFAEIESDEKGQEYDQSFTKGKWMGWDYGHAGDWDYPIMTRGQDNKTWNKSMGNKFWEYDEVEKDVLEAIDEMLDNRS